MTYRIMLLGAKGQVGKALQATTLPEEWALELYGRAELDITNPNAVRVAIQSLQPDMVINAAGLTNVDYAQKNEDLAMTVNFRAAAAIAANCSALDIPLLHLSTDYVFDGRDEAPYEPDAPMNPVNIYGYSKMMGEEAIRHELAWHTILRISSVFSGFGPNLLTKTLNLINTQSELRMVNDQQAAPTPATSVAEAIITIASAVLLGKSGSYGTFHFCGTPSCSRYDLTRTIMEAYLPHTDKRPKISPVTSDVFVDFAPRPRNAVLNCAKTEQIFGLQQPDWKEAILPEIRRTFEETAG